MRGGGNHYGSRDYHHLYFDHNFSFWDDVHLYMLLYWGGVLMYSEYAPPSCYQLPPRRYTLAQGSEVVHGATAALMLWVRIYV